MSIRVIFLLLQLVHLIVTSHVGLKFCCQLLVTVKVLGEVGEPACRAIPSAAHAPTNYEAPRLNLSWSCCTAVFSFPLISQEQVTADLYYSKFIVACGSLKCPAVTTACAGQRAMAHVGSSSPGICLNPTATLDCTGSFGFKILYIFLRTLSLFELSDLKQSAWTCWFWGGLMCSSSCSGSWGVVPAVAAAECHIAGSCAPVPPVPLKMDHDSQVVGAASYWTHSVPPHTVDGDVPQHPLISDHAPLSKSLLISSVPAASLWRCSLWEQHTYISASGKPRNICWSSWPLRETFSLDQQWKTLGFWYWSLLPSAIPNQKLSCILQCQSSPCTPSGRCCQCGFIPWPAGVKIQRKIPSLFLQNQ